MKKTDRMGDADTLIELIALDAIKQHIINLPPEVKIFKLHDLESIYLEALCEAEVEKQSHISRFAEKVSINDCGVVPLQKDSNTMRLAVRNETFDSVINTNSEWLSMAKHVVAPIWNDILNKISSPEISDLCTEIKEYEVSLKL